MRQFSDLAATVTLHSRSSRLCIWLHGKSTLHAAYRQRSDPATHWTVCARGEREEGGGQRSRDEDEDNESRVCRRWEWGQSQVGKCKEWIWGIKTEGGSIRTCRRDKAKEDGRVWAKDSWEERERRERVLEKRWSMERWWLTPVVVKLWFILSVFSGSYTVGVWGSLLALGRLEQRLNQP